MPNYLLRFEGVNLDSFVFDTDRLPTIRGGSLLLLRAVGEVETWLRDEGSISGLETVSRGASAGLFRFAAADAGAAESARALVEHRLGEDPRLCHATFVVDVVLESSEAVDGFRLDAERLLAKNRFRQMRAPSVAMPVAPGAKEPCAVDRIRPAVATQAAPRSGDQEKVSASVAVRTREGRKAKQEFYDIETGKVWSHPRPFAFDFHQIADDPKRGSLHGKMAVLHLDGNSFGAIQRQECTTWELQKEFDQALRGYRRELLKDLLTEIDGRSDWLWKDTTYRFETLLWGGDEMIWVVPAWHGWWLLSFALERMAGWKFKGEPLHHAAGLVFCHAKAPIRRITKLAEALTGLAKAVGKARDNPRSTAAYQVLESFDLAPESFAAFRAKRSPAGAAEQLIVDGGNARQLAESIQTLGSALPRGKVYRAVAELAKEPPGGRAEIAEIEILRGIAKANGVETALAELEQASASPAAAWFHLAELWDYLVDFSPETETEGNHAAR